MAGAAAALHAELGPEVCFLDSDAIELEEMFPRRLAMALDAARVIVVLATPGYFERWYCLREWMAALLPWTSAAGSQNASELDHVIVALGAPFSPEDRQRLPPPIQQRNLPSAADIKSVARLVSERLAFEPPTLGDRLAATGGRSALDLFTADAALPFVTQTTTGIPICLPPGIFAKDIARLWISYCAGHHHKQA